MKYLPKRQAPPGSSLFLPQQEVPEENPVFECIDSDLNERHSDLFRIFIPAGMLNRFLVACNMKVGERKT